MDVLTFSVIRKVKEEGERKERGKGQKKGEKEAGGRERESGKKTQVYPRVKCKQPWSL